MALPIFGTPRCWWHQTLVVSKGERMKRGFNCSSCKKRFSTKDTDMYKVDGKQYCPDCYSKLVRGTNDICSEE